MLSKEYRTISNISGPLMMVESTQDVRYDELAEIELASGERRRGRVLEIESDRALVQVFEGTSGIDTNETKVRFLGKVQTLPVSRGMLGRVFNGRGEPIDGGAPLIAEQTLDINGMPMNPYSRDFPSEFIQTGISTIDGLNPMVRGQKLPISSGARGSWGCASSRGTGSFGPRTGAAGTARTGRPPNAPAPCWR